MTSLIVFECAEAKHGRKQKRNDPRSGVQMTWYVGVKLEREASANCPPNVNINDLLRSTRIAK
jgi:hypothetical protein